LRVESWMLRVKGKSLHGQKPDTYHHNLRNAIHYAHDDVCSGHWQRHNTGDLSGKLFLSRHSYKRKGKRKHKRKHKIRYFLSESSKQIIFSSFIKKISKIYNKLLISHNSKKNIFDIIFLILVNIFLLIILYDVYYKDYESVHIFEIKFITTIYYIIIEVLFIYIL
jgi:hypothetical protein